MDTQLVNLSILSGVLGSVSTWAIQSAREWWSSPRLNASFEDKLPFRLETQVAVENSQPHDAVYFRIGVRNDGVTNAKSCRGFLLGVDEDSGKGLWRPTQYCDNLPLTWAYRSKGDSEQGIDIPRGVNQFLDVFSISESVTGFKPLTSAQTRKADAHDRFKAPGMFRFRILVVAENAKSQFFGLCLEWKGDWQQAWQGNGDGLKVRQCTDFY